MNISDTTGHQMEISITSPNVCCCIAWNAVQAEYAFNERKKKTSKNTPDIIDFNLIDHQIFIILVREKQNKQNVRWSKEKSQ